MMKTFSLALLALGIAGSNLAYGQREPRSNDTDRTRRNESYTNTPRTDDNQRNLNEKRTSDTKPTRSAGISPLQLERAVINAYKEGYRDGMENARKLNTVNRLSTRNRRINPDPSVNHDNQANRSATDNTSSDRLSERERQVNDRIRTADMERMERRMASGANGLTPYPPFSGGFYAGLNTTRYLGENIDADNLSGRLGYQLGIFTRFGGRVYGQLGAEYFASSSNYFVPGDGQNLRDIAGRIDTKWLQVPALVGVRLGQGYGHMSGIRLAVGAEYANRLSGTNTVQINDMAFKRGSFLGVGNLGFDFGPVALDLMYHHGLSDVIGGFNNSRRRSFSINVGLNL